MKRNEIAAIGTRVLWTRHSEAPSETRNEKYMIFECDYNYSGSATIAIFAIVYRHLITKATPGKFINRRPISVGIGETIVFAFTNYTQCLTKYMQQYKYKRLSVISCSTVDVARDVGVIQWSQQPTWHKVGHWWCMAYFRITASKYNKRCENVLSVSEQI